MLLPNQAIIIFKLRKIYLSLIKSRQLTYLSFLPEHDQDGLLLNVHHLLQVLGAVVHALPPRVHKQDTLDRASSAEASCDPLEGDDEVEGGEVDALLCYPILEGRLVLFKFAAHALTAALDTS